jgi:hypothetical protein
VVVREERVRVAYLRMCGVVWLRVQRVVRTWISHALIDDHHSYVELLRYTHQMLDKKNRNVKKSSSRR